uniref:Citrate synthase n=1 Tax=Prasinoderma coloniale TaxID=156133 RepID=A0A7R9Y1Z4_9VIRI
MPPTPIPGALEHAPGALSRAFSMTSPTAAGGACGGASGYEAGAWKLPTDATPAEDRKARDVATLTLPDGRAFDLPVLRDAKGTVFVDVQRLHGASGGVCTYDNGFGSTASCISAITYIDGAAGKLYYRGYSIEDLAEHSDFEEVMFLLLDGELPTREERQQFVGQLKQHGLVHEQLVNLFKAFKHDAHPMSIMCAAVAALSSFYPMRDLRDKEEAALATLRLIAKVPTLAAMAYKTAIGEPAVYPRDDLGFVENFLHMMFARPTGRYEVDPVVVRAIEVFFVLHADHEQNASTSTVRTAGSSQASPYACLSSGIASLWGPAHGGANEAVIKMLDEIGTVDRIPLYIAKAKDKSDPFRLMGFGHRVYKNYDPRSREMRRRCHEVLGLLDVEDPKLAVAMRLEDIALTDEYFIRRSLYPNVDFYSGILLRAVGFPVSMFTVLFAVARSVGWAAQWKEMVSAETVPRINRPRQIYVGELEREYVGVDERVVGGGGGAV